MSRHSPIQPRPRPQPSVGKVGRALRASRPCRRLCANCGSPVPNPYPPPDWVPVKFNLCPRMSMDVHRCPRMSFPLLTSEPSNPAKFSFSGVLGYSRIFQCTLQMIRPFHEPPADSGRTADYPLQNFSKNFTKTLPFLYHFQKNHPKLCQNVPLSTTTPPAPTS